ncbi:MAG: DUF5665 domain-containing protein [bacterium]
MSSQNHNKDKLDDEESSTTEKQRFSYSETISRLERLIHTFERMNLAEYISLLQRPRRLIFLNFLAGLSRGLGIGIGMTLLAAIVLYILSLLVDLPLIGSYVAKIVKIVHEETKRGF